MENDNCGLICRDFFLYHWRGLIIFFTPLILLPLPILMRCVESNLLYIMIIMIVYWAFEVIPPGATALIPIVLYPAFGVVGSQEACQQYMKNSIFTFLGGMVIALACEHSKLHKRLALVIMIIFGCKPRSLQFGLMLVSFLSSMVLTNVAITIMMCPIVTAVMEELQVQGVCSHFQEPGPNDVESKYAKTEDADEPKYPSAVSISMYLGVAYAATVGGTLTLFGSVTNLIYAEFSKNTTKYLNPGAEDGSSPKNIDFLSVFSFNAPIMIIEFLIIFLCLQALHMGLFRSGDNKPFTVAKEGTNAVIKEKLTELGPMSVHEIQVVIFFIILVILLFTREITVKFGWGQHANEGKMLDSCVIMLIVIVMFMIPANYTFLKYCFGEAPFTTKPAPSLVSWKMVQSFVPWGTMFLIGGGYAIGDAIERTFMSRNIVVKYAEVVTEMSPSHIILLSILSATALTQICSNVAVVNIMMYFMRDFSAIKGLHNVDFIFPIGVACSIAFILPVSTPANAIVYHYAHIKTLKMFIAGIIPTIVLLVLLMVFCQFWYPIIYGYVTAAEGGPALN